MEEEAAGVEMRKKRKPSPAENNEIGGSDTMTKKKTKEEIRFRGSCCEGGASASSPAESNPSTPPSERQTKAPSEENVKEFYAILRRVRDVAKYLKKNGGGDIDWLTTTTAPVLETGLDGVCGGGSGRVKEDMAGVMNKVEEARVLNFNAVCFDLNAAPQAAEE
ncbi:hypothetical protein Dimus_025170 [Dionaea muscipula]